MPTRYALTAALTLSIVASTARAEIRFTEVSSLWGIDFVHRHGETGEYYMPATMGSGVVAFDYDGDGDPDLLFVDSGALGEEAAPGRCKLYRNDGAGRFVDVSEIAGIAVSGYGMGGAAADIDGDGDLDLYVTAFGADQLFENRGDGTFADVTEKAGLGNAEWGTSAAFADTDGDGDLDLYVTNYVDFTLENNRICGQVARGLRSYCHPDVYDGAADRFYENQGDGTFVDATERAGFGAARGKGLGVTFLDIDDDRDLDLYVANDMTPNYLFRNQGEGQFVETGLVAGVAFSDRGAPEAGMGVAAGDLDGNGRPDLIVTHLDLQTNAFYANLGQGLFADRRSSSGLAEPSLMSVGFGVGLGDLDLDGDLDAVVANGHIIHNVEQWETGSTYRQPNQVYENVGRGKMREVPEAGLDVVRSSRGLALADLDGDGDLDLAISNSNEAAEVYRNESPRPAGLAVIVPGGLAVGVRLEAQFESSPQMREIRTGTSYLSQHQRSVLFGGEGAPVALTIHWPDRTSRKILTPPVGHALRIPPRKP